MEDWLLFHESLWRQFSISTNFTTTNNKWAKFLQQQQQKNQCWWKVNLKKYDLMVIIVQLTNGIAWSRISSFDTSKIHSIIQYIKRQRKYEKWFHIDINFNHIHHKYSRHKFSPFCHNWLNKLGLESRNFDSSHNIRIAQDSGNFTLKWLRCGLFIYIYIYAERVK